MRQPGTWVIPPGEFEGYICDTFIGLGPADFAQLDQCAIVHVAGSGPKKQVDELFKNPFGHTLLYLGPGIGYVHSCEPGFHKCRYLPEEDWSRYCTAMGKPLNPEAVIRVGDKITNRGIVQAAVNNRLVVGYDWAVTHDCATMVDDVLATGGVPAKFLSNTVMPSVAVFKHKAKGWCQKRGW